MEKTFKLIPEYSDDHLGAVDSEYPGFITTPVEGMGNLFELANCSDLLQGAPGDKESLYYLSENLKILFVVLEGTRKGTVVQLVKIPVMTTASAKLRPNTKVDGEFGTVLTMQARINSHTMKFTKDTPHLKYLQQAQGVTGLLARLKVTFTLDMITGDFGMVASVDMCMTPKTDITDPEVYSELNKVRWRVRSFQLDATAILRETADLEIELPTV